MTVATIGLNASLWMRHKAMAAARGGWSDGDFVAALTALGCTPRVIDVIRKVLAHHYMASLSPRPDDSLRDVLRISPDEIEEIVERLFQELDLPEPTRSHPEHIPELFTVGDLATYIQQRCDQSMNR